MFGSVQEARMGALERGEEPPVKRDFIMVFPWVFRVTVFLFPYYEYWLIYIYIIYIYIL